MSAGTLAQATLPDSAKQALCRSLLEEFGVTKIRATDKGELICCCPLPWHNEIHPSASLNYKKLVFRCLSCDSGGGLLWFIASCRGDLEREARKWLDGSTGFGSEVDLGALLNLIDQIYAERKPEHTPIPKMPARILDPWLAIHPYLTEKRHIPEKNLMRMRVGYAPDLQISERQRSARIIIPHFWKGTLTGWQSRRMVKDGTPKYLSTEDFPKHQTIYNYHPEWETAFVVESPMSVLRHLHHLPICGTFGAAITDAQIRLLAVHKRVVFCMDNDTGGYRAIEGWWEKQKKGPPKLVSPGAPDRLQAYTDVRVWENPWAADMGDMDDDTAADLAWEAVPFSVWRKPDPGSLREWTGE